MNEWLRDCLLPGVLVVDVGHVVSGVNAAAERLLGIEASAISGRPYDSLPSPIQAFVSEALTSERSLDRQARLVFGSREVPLHLSSTVCLGTDGKRSGVVIVMTAQELHQQLQRMDRLASVGTVSAGMAHEIKNALVAVRTFTDDLLLRNKDSDLAEIVSRELRRIDRIVSQMLNLASPPKPVFAPVSLHHVVKRSIQLVQSQLSDKEIELALALAANPDVVFADEYQLEQACLNLLFNAVEALPPGGSLRIATERFDRPAAIPSVRRVIDPTRCIQLSISDNGPGIDPTHLEQVFEPFFSTRPDGTGLGLAITRQIILEHEGEITVQSELKKGTTFRVRLPLAENPA